jgi:hypothetical protein
MESLKRQFAADHDIDVEKASSGADAAAAEELAKQLDPSYGRPLPQPVVYSHELLQAFSFHLFAKRPIEPVVCYTSLRRLEFVRNIDR